MSSNFEVLKDRDSSTIDESLEALRKEYGDKFIIHGFAVDGDKCYCVLYEIKGKEK